MDSKPFFNVDFHGAIGVPRNSTPGGVIEANNRWRFGCDFPQGRRRPFGVPWQCLNLKTMVQIRLCGRDMMHGHGFIDTNGVLDMFDASFVAEMCFFFTRIWKSN